MLAHSKRWIDAGAIPVVSDARNLPLENGTVDLLVASLADPFDDFEWWLEVARVLAPEGKAVVTTPASRLGDRVSKYS